MSRKVVDVTKIFASNVFDDETMRKCLPTDIYHELKYTMEKGGKLDPHVAEVVANEMKEWAIEKGATHFTHWFQPLTGVTAEKHDSFIKPVDDSHIVMEFSGKELIKGESDGSSFPSGGLRATFEARGYTAWDLTSPAFIHEIPDGTTVLYIPTVFLSYTGEALDKKTPLLRSMEAINKQCLRILRLFGDTETKKVTTNVGAEQEYFIIDKALYDKRKDLIFTGRTLFGAPAPKGHELDDHYYGSIDEKVLAYMDDLNEELWKVGVAAKTQHKEVAPMQHELAPVFDSTNIATDHNQIIMDTMKKVALRRDMVCLLHEKPFAGINGSGKHNNWSMSTDKGINLLKPGKKPHENTLFMLILTAVLKAVDDYAPLMRISAACAGNDHRLGANEAPPAIISVFLGEQLEDVLEQLCKKGVATHSISGSRMDLEINAVPTFKRDATDRNRTSPFAFTGNKFEFRSVGSSQSIADANIVLNTIIAEELSQAADILENAKDFKTELNNLLHKWAADHIRVVFNGDGYSEEWVKEAKLRGLPNITNTVDAISYLTWDKAVEVFEKHHVFSKVELASRQEIGYESYAKSINIEARTMIDMANEDIIPAVINYITDLAESVEKLDKLGIDAKAQKNILDECQLNLNEMHEAVKFLEEVTAASKVISSEYDKAKAYRDFVIPVMNRVRKYADKLETMVDKKMWPFPTYADILFNL